ncbi:MAG: VCBS repeat-containing protein [Planctomycetes bacterium]|nr:VCBS repeat-containing protein [Planctomycetota bacterium]
MASPPRTLRRIGFSATLLLLPPLSRTQGYPVWEATGTGDGAGFGSGQAGVGDIDGDGLFDFVVNRLGAASAGSPVRALSGATGLTLYVVGGFALSGPSLSKAGDLDGDGVLDFVVPSGPSPTLARAFSGADGSPLMTFDVPSGPSGSYSVAYSCAGAGDVDLDGVPDVILGSPNELFNQETARVFSGSTGSLLLTFTGNLPSAQFGRSVAGIGDVDSDLQADLLVGAPWADPPAPGLPGGRVQAFSGATGALLYTVNGIGPGELFGFATAGIDDVDGDAIPDFLVGSPSGGPWGPPTGLGRGAVFSGVNGALVLSVVGTIPFAGFGRFVAPSGDVDGDDVTDFGIGAPFAVAASPAGSVGIFSGSTGGLLFTLTGASGDGGFGSSFVGEGDATNDGIPDLLVGAPGTDAGGWIDSGIARLYSFVGIPPGSSLFGSGCPGSGGAVPLLATAGGEPSVSTGNSGFRLVLSRALAGTTATLAAGASSSSWAGIPLPLDLGPFGMPGCSLLVSADVLLPATTGGSGPLDGRTFFPAPIPVAPSLAGSTIYLQWYVVDPGPAPVPGAMSRGLALVLL